MKIKDKKMTKPRITRTILRNKDDQVDYVEIKDYVKQVGDSGYVALPIELVGDYVLIKCEVLSD